MRRGFGCERGHVAGLGLEAIAVECAVGAMTGADACGTLPEGDGAGCATNITTVAQLTVASAASGAERRASAARRVRQS
jgi:hypothetical protein